jgi:hypothetical protein
MTERYGQLTYTSFDTARAAGGWQVKQTTGDLSPEEVASLVAGVRTAFQPAEPLPAYPTPAELDRIPRRLAYERSGDVASYWHTVPAGADGTGRPGNVFAHALLDRRPADPAGHRPIQLWRSTRWLCPYGPHAVSVAELTAGPPGPGDVVTKQSVVAFALDPGCWRLATLLGLLDAVAAALQGGRPVILGAKSTDSAAQWIGLVSFLMSAGTAAGLNFATFDRANQLDAGAAGRQQLTAVPVDDLPEMPSDVVAIDETATMSLGEFGGEPHRTAQGQLIEVTAWSAMAQVVLLDPRAALLALDDIDRYATEAGDAGLHPAWPMAMAVAAHPEFADAAEEARTVIGANSPAGAVGGPTIAHSLAGAIVALSGTSTADAWHAVQLTTSDPSAALADVTYLCRAIDDDEWLDRPGTIPVRQRQQGLAPTPQLDVAIGPALERARGAGPQRLLRVIDLLLRAGVDDPRLVAAAGDVAPHLRSREASGVLVRALGDRIGTRTRLAAAAAVLRTDGNSTGPVTDEAIDWLADGSSAPRPDELSRAQPWDITWTRAAVRGARALRWGPVDSADRLAGLWWLRICGSAQFDREAAAAVWAPDELLVAAGGGAVSAAAVLPTLLGAPDSAGLDELARAVIDAAVDQTAVACAAVRLIEPKTWAEQGYIESYQAIYAPHWELALSTVPSHWLHHDFAIRLLTLAVVAAMSGQPYPPGCSALATTALGHEAVGNVLALIDATPDALRAAVARSLLALPDEEAAAVPSGVGELVRQVAHHIVVGHDFSDDDVGATVFLAAQLANDTSDGSLRRYRKMVTNLLGRQPGPQPSLRTRLRGNR